jgi:ABC-type branched-subunit amino acid transport system substrate-binding protein
MKKRQSWWMIGISVVIFLFAGYGLSLAQTEKVIKLGVINPMTGPAAPWGLSEQCAMERFKVMFNGKWGGITVNGQKYKVDFVYADDKYTVAGGRAAAEKLIYIDKVDFLVASLGAEPISAWAPLATKEKILAVVGGPTWNPKPAWPYLFRVTSNDAERAEALVRLMKEQYGAKSVLYIMSDDLVGRNAKENAVKSEKDRGLDVKGYLMVPPNAQDFYPFLSKALKSNPDYLHCKLPPGSVALVIKQARELGYKGKIGYPTSMPGNLKKWQEIAGIEASMGFVAIASTPMEELTPKGVETEALIPQMCPAYGVNDIAYAMQPHILMMAIEKAQSLDPDKVLKVLRTEEFHSYLKIPLKASGEKTFGIKNHMTVTIPFSIIVGENQIKYLKAYYIMTP